MKDFTPGKVFILENGEYQELTIEEHRNRRENDEEYKTRKFIGLHGMIMEVSESDYLEHYRVKRRQKYLNEAAAERGDISYDALITGECNGEKIFVDLSGDAAEIVERRIILDKLRLAVSMLPEEEKELLKVYFYDGKSQTELAERFRISQQAVSKRISKICVKLKNLMEN